METAGMVDESLRARWEFIKIFRDVLADSFGIKRKVQTHEGGDGFDTVTYASSPAGVRVDLGRKDADGYSSGSGGDAENDRLRGIEKLVGSAHADTFIGDDAHNAFRGGGGGDTLDGGDGFDVASYASSRDGVRIDLSRKDAAGFSTGSGGDAEGDRLCGIEHLTGSDTGDDELIGDDGANRLIGRGGADILDGRGGVDTVSWRYSKVGVRINLGQKDAEGYSTGSGGNAEGDRLRNIENLIGSRHDDILTGDAGANRLTGGEGRDLLDGGGGVDTVSWRYSKAGVVVDLSRKDIGGYSTGSGGSAEGDRIRSIENLAGSEYNDILTGDVGANRLVGRGGADVLTGGGGADVLGGGEGRDTLTGGADGDRFLVGDLNTDLDRADHITDFTGSGTERDTLFVGPATTRIWYRHEDADGDGDTDTVIYTDAAMTGIYVILDGYTGTLEAGHFVDSNGNAANLTVTRIDAPAPTVNMINGTAGPDTLVGTADRDIIRGFGANDTLLGMGGDDLLIGGGGADIMNGGAGTDTASWAGSPVGVSVLLQSPPQPAAPQDPRPDPDTGKFDFDDLFGPDEPAPASAPIPNGLLGDAQGDVLSDIENLTGSDHDDRLGGDEGANVLDGGGGNDILAGHGGNDTLIGGAGEDVLGGGDGRDVLTGGAGSDRFLVGLINTSLEAADRITDFTGAGDARDSLFIGRTSGSVWYRHADADGDGDTDTVIYADAARRGVHAVLEDYTGTLGSGHFVDHDGNATSLTVTEIL